jgi:hypothetical protein
MWTVLRIALRLCWSALLTIPPVGVVLAVGVQSLETIEVIGAGTSELGTADASSQGSIERQGLQARPAYRAGELLEAVPGLIVTQHSGEGKANQYFLRGFNLDHGTDLAIFVDGMPVNMRTHGHGQGYADLSFLIPELVARADYKKGPYFADEGDFASAGVARLVLVDRLAEQALAGSIGSFGYRRVLVAGSPDTFKQDVVYAFEYGQSDGPWARPDNLGKVNALLRLGEGNAANGWTATAMAYRGNWHATDQIPRRAVDDGTLNRFDSLDRTDGGNAHRYSLSGGWRRTDANGVTRLNAYAIQSDFNLFSNFTYFLNDPVNGDQFEQSDRRSVWGADVSHTWLGTLGMRPMENTLGVQSRFDRIRLGLFNTVERQRLATTRDDRVAESSAGAYGQNRVQWNGWLRTIAGLRIDQYQGKVESDHTENSGTAHDHLVSPKASVIFGPWSKSELYLNWGRGFHSNDLRGATIKVDPTSGAPADRVPLLVRTRGEEIGMRTEVIRGLALTAAVFRLDIDSELVFVGDAGTTEASRASRRVGTEVTARYSPLPWLSFDLDYAQTRARFREDDPAGRFIPGAPDRIASAKVMVDRLGPWSGSLTLRHFGARPLIEDNSVRSSGTTLLAGKLAYRFDKRLRMELAGFNLADRKVSQIDYFYESRLRSEGGPVGDVHFHPAEPRSFRLAVIASF